MIDMKMTQATEVRKEWSAVCDNIIHDRPQFVKRTRDKMCFSSFDTMLDILQIYQYTAERFVEEDGSITLSLNEMDIIANGNTDIEVRERLSMAIMEYAEEYYENYKMYSSAPNRKGHIPYILKALIINSVQKIGDSLICQDGENYK